MHDLVIRGGKVVDGTGRPAYGGDVAVDGDRIVAVGEVDGQGRREIDADGAIVTPGWVDIHTHYDGQIMWDPEVSPSGWHGVTTVVIGNCGVGFAPMRPTEREWLIQLMEGVEDIPGRTLAEGMSWAWESFSEYLDEVGRTPRVLDVAAMLAHGALRAYVLGCDRNNDDPTDDEIALMAKVAREAIEAGAVGISSTRTIGHRAKDGQPAAGTFAKANELLAIGEALADAGRRVFSVASDRMSSPGDEFAWMAELSRRARNPVTYMVTVNSASWREDIDQGLECNREGAWLVPQVSGRPITMMVGWESTTHPFSDCPTYRGLADLPLAERVSRLRDPDVRQSILDEVNPSAKRVVDPHAADLVSNITHALIGNLYALGDPPDYEPPPEKSVGAIAAREGRSTYEVAYDVMLEGDGQSPLYMLVFTPEVGYSNFDTQREALVHPATVLGLADGGAHASQICDASMPTFLLTHWVRDRTRGERIPLEKAVQLYTSRTAALFGFSDRGRIEPGLLADLNVIDFDGLRLGGVRMSYDLPAGAKRLVQGASGYLASVKSGVVVRELDQPTGERPGRLVRASMLAGTKGGS